MFRLGKNPSLSPTFIIETSFAMPQFNILKGTIICLLLMKINGNEEIQRGVDLVTNLSNGIIPPVMKGISGGRLNVVVGPFGLLSNLAMILEGSTGKTKQEILKALKISNEQLPDLRTGFKAYCELFLEHASEEEATGSFNSAAISSNFNLGDDYKSTISNNYCANVSESKFITENVLMLRSDAGVMSHWRDYEKLAVYTFLSHQSLLPFTKSNGDTVNVPMIPQVGVFKKGRFETSVVVLLPLQTKFFHLLLVVPEERTDLDSLASKLINRNLPHLIETLTKSEMEVFIPQLTAVSKELNLTEILVRSGIRQAFDPKKANLAVASENSTLAHVEKITQNAYFSTSFVAVNSVSGTSTSFGSSRRKRDTRKFYVDRPFLFFLLHKNTQLVLLAGKIGDPVQVPS